MAAICLGLNEVVPNYIPELYTLYIKFYNDRLIISHRLIN